MRNSYSLVVCIVVSLFLLYHRASHPGFHEDKPLNVTAWDAFGYYMYLPAAIIYHDMTQLEWLPEMDSTYNLTGGKLYQAHRKENGNYVYKYLGGVSIMQLPLFLIGHAIASITVHPADGFSPPYQYAIAFGVIIYVILALFLLRVLLLRYFNDQSVAISILLLVLATNLPQYVSVDGGMSHAYIFPLYVAVLYTTMRWHLKPHILWASLTGGIIGLAMICRPTEAIMLFIPLLWDTQTKEAGRAKWAKVKMHKSHLLWVVLFGFLGILPQLIYWKMASGSFIYDVGSKWVFLNPFFRVLFGWEAGWFIYTPVTILFILGFFFMKKYPFQRSVIVFCLLNIWIIISWFDWKYGATYSTRALVQSYPLFAFPLTAIIERINRTKWRYLFYLLGLYLIIVNLFQLKQYYNTVLHYRDMNRAYYGRIYLNPQPTPLDMSLLDSCEFLRNAEAYNSTALYASDSVLEVTCAAGTSGVIAQVSLPDEAGKQEGGEEWVKITATVKAQKGFEDSYLCGEIISNDTSIHRRVRLFSPISQAGATNPYAFYMKLPAAATEPHLMLYINTGSYFSGIVTLARVSYLSKPDSP